MRGFIKLGPSPTYISELGLFFSHAKLEGPLLCGPLRIPIENKNGQKLASFSVIFYEGPKGPKFLIIILNKKLCYFKITLTFI